MPLSPRKANTKYTTTESNNTSQIGRDEKENYFEFVVKCANGYDFLESLLKIHPMIEILPEWQDIQLVACNDGTRQKQVKQFVHDVTTLMKLLLGSANMAVDNYGNFIYENLPYGPIRSNRGSLSRTALGTNGSIKRICDELQRCWFSKQETDKYIQRLQRLHLHLRFPSFEQQREDIDGLLSIEYSNSTPSMKL